MSQFSTSNLNHIFFSSPLVGYASSKNVTKNQQTGSETWQIEIWKTIDGGNSWFRSLRADNARDVFKVLAVSDEIAFASIDGNRLIRTKDGGKTWQDVFSNKQPISSIGLSSDQVIWVVGEGLLFKSNDYGTTWQQPTGVANDLLNKKWSSISFGKSKNGLVVSEDGYIAYTDDNGKAWRLVPEQQKDVLHEVTVYDNIGIVLGGQNIYKVDF
jgi:photosystem II stability/assembly factor-like uncharacterized protein